MAHSFEKQYFFSIQPYWPAHAQKAALYNADGTVCAKRFAWGDIQSIECVPGNAQIGIMIQDADDFKAWCYGVLPEKREIPLHGMQNVISLHFSPGTFSRILRIPAREIDPDGIPAEDLFSREQIAALRDAAADPYPMSALLLLFGRWAERPEVSLSLHDYQLACDVSFNIWNEGGLIQMKELEQRTGYCERHLRNIVKDYIGVSPKQLCRQTRFQHSLQYLNRAGGDSLVNAAVLLGYTDQAHMTHEFKTLLGRSPAEYQNRKKFQTVI